MNDDDEGQGTMGVNLELGVGVGGYYSTSSTTCVPFVGMSFSLKNEPVARSTDDDDIDQPIITNHSSRKKLRLSKQQSTLLEDTFKLHTTLNPVQKQTLAEQLNLKPRQVEVWFQNRRARTKLKQTEVDCEYLKRCCEGLSQENRRLKKELQQLKDDTN